MAESNEYYEFYFKLAYTCQTKFYLVNPDISIKNFIEDIKQRALIDFNAEPHEDIEIVEAGQSNNINGRDAELAPSLENSNDTVRQIYGGRYKTTAFYIRKIPRVLSIDMPENNEIDDIITPSISRANSNNQFNYNNV
jgi:hypothetical protein